MKSTMLMVLAMVGVGALLMGCSPAMDVDSLNPAKAVSSETGIALAIVVDNSGSMDSSVRNENGKNEPKKAIASRALIKVIETLKHYSDNGKRIQVGVVTFDFCSSAIVVPMGDFNYEALMNYARDTGGGQNTPLGVSVGTAAGMVLHSPMSEKHIIILSDGLNNSGPSPSEIMSSPEYLKVTQEHPIGTYFVAFDIDGSQYDSLKPLGAKIFEATDEKELDLKFSEILVKEILFEDPGQ